MDIEYQKKEVTWCLDRDGPRICLRAVAINDKLKSLEITCERFRIEFENEEAKDFLLILRRIIDSKSEPKPDYLEEVKTEQVEIVNIPESPVPSSSEFTVAEKTATLDTSEILDVLKQSEANVEEAQAPLLDLLRNQQNLDLGLDEKDITTDEIPVDQSGIMIEENVKPSDLFKESFDTASFFHDGQEDENSEEMTPLEQLLEDDTKQVPSPIPQQEILVTTVHKENIPPKTVVKENSQIKPFSPDDLASPAFISDFDSKKEEMIDSPPKIDESPSLPSAVDEISEFTESPETKKYSSTEERRREIEKEREARKKRLWELTRGF
ncbi:MAG: hypothetical protein ACXACP_02330 [Candidatus Hodarchaeales archaeon]|jgi:hypothetical protein